LRQGIVEQGVAARERINQRQPAILQADFLRECQVSQQRSGQAVAQGCFCRPRDGASLVVNRKNEQLFGDIEVQHLFLRFDWWRAYAGAGCVAPASAAMNSPTVG
jgi:hypothetical protein